MREAHQILSVFTGDQNLITNNAISILVPVIANAQSSVEGDIRSAIPSFREVPCPGGLDHLVVWLRTSPCLHSKGCAG